MLQGKLHNLILALIPHHANPAPDRADGSLGYNTVDMFNGTGCFRFPSVAMLFSVPTSHGGILCACSSCNAY